MDSDNKDIVFLGYGMVTGAYFVFDSAPTNFELHNLSGWKTYGYDNGSEYRMLISVQNIHIKF